jgi:hypothetical protein
MPVLFVVIRWPDATVLLPRTGDLLPNWCRSPESISDERCESLTRGVAPTNAKGMASRICIDLKTLFGVGVNGLPKKLSAQRRDFFVR